MIVSSGLITCAVWYWDSGFGVCPHGLSLICSSWRQEMVRLVRQLGVCLFNSLIARQLESP